MDGSDVRRLRERNNWSQNDLATAINATLGKNYGSGSISPWETGKRPVPADVASFLQRLAVETALPDEPASPPPPSPDVAPAVDVPPGDGTAPPSAQPTIGGGGAWARACEELWELIATGVGMVGAATGNGLLVDDGAIIAQDKEALGAAWGKLAETNETFRKMLIGMTEGGAWLQVALVTGTTVSKCWQNHARYQLAEAPTYSDGQPDYDLGAAAA